MKLTSLVYLDATLQDAALQWAGRFAVPCVDGSSIATAKPKFFQRFLAEQCADEAEAFVFVLGRDGVGLHAVGAERGGSLIHI